MKNAPYIGLARKYRPQLFEDVVGQEAVAVTLGNAVESQQTAAAYLFFGPKGVGKTTSARILAKALNCKEGPTPKPCGKCPSCSEIAGGTSIDVLELDAASNTQVDKIREMIIETVSLAPSRDRRKVFIIDEVHMLSASSFNALLKTLEEPPPHVVFILATTELAKLPATIVSRCQRFRFRPLTREAAAGHLAKLAKSEKIDAETKALELLARAAGGSLRDAVSLFDQAAAHGDGSITVKSVAELMGTLPEELLLGVARSVLGKDAKALAGWLARVSEEGFDQSQLLRDLRERLQQLYLLSLNAGAEAEAPWKALAEGRGPETFSFLIKRVNRALEELRTADSPQLAFELGLYGMLEAAHDLRQWVERLEALERRVSAGGPAAAAPAPRLVAPSLTPAAAAAIEAPVDAPPPAPAQPRRREGVENVWPAALSRLAEQKPLLAAALEGSRLIPSEAGPWRLVFKLAFSLERAKAGQAAIEAELTALAGRPVELSLEVGGGAEARAAKPAAPAAQEGWVDSSVESAPGEDPAVKKVLGAFGGRVKSVKKPPKT